jgi:hypothetical protein
MPLTEPLRYDAWDVPLNEWDRHFKLPETLASRLAVSTKGPTTMAKALGGGQADEL